mmetsp:Transcript_10984/g.34915  ORF Transcript_10984/g.34915 Transcript_10984/m.34915 type:complete len:229 (-) Transcript_10984:130-816(-)
MKERNGAPLRSQRGGQRRGSSSAPSPTGRGRAEIGRISRVEIASGSVASSSVASWQQSAEQQAAAAAPQVLTRDGEHSLRRRAGQVPCAEVVGADHHDGGEGAVRRERRRELAPVAQPPKQVLRLVARDCEHSRRGPPPRQGLCEHRGRAVGAACGSAVRGAAPRLGDGVAPERQRIRARRSSVCCRFTRQHGLPSEPLRELCRRSHATLSAWACHVRLLLLLRAEEN